MTQVNTEETRTRSTMFNAMLQLTHRQYGPMVSSLRSMMDQDAEAVARYCTYLLRGNTKIRDQQDAAAITLLTAPAWAQQYRIAGRALVLGDSRAGGAYQLDPSDTYSSYRGLPIYRFLRIERFMASPYIINHNGSEVDRAATSAMAESKLPKVAGRLTAELRRRSKNDKALVEPTELSIVLDQTHVKAPRLMRSIVKDFFNMLEDDRHLADASVFQNKPGIKSLFKRYRMSSTRFPILGSLLFTKEPPSWSKQSHLRAIAEATSPREQLRLVEQYKISARILQSVLPDTPQAKIVLLAAMSPKEAQNYTAAFEIAGLFTMPEFKQAYLEKIGQLSDAGASAEHRKSARSADADVEIARKAVVERSLKKGKRIQRTHALLIDRSGSMSRAIEGGIMMAGRIAAISDAEFKVIAFGTYALEVTLPPNAIPSLATWQQAFRGINAGGGTNMENALNLLHNEQFFPEQITIVSDGGEWQGSFVRGLASLKLQSDDPLYEPQLIFIRVPGNDRDYLSPRVAEAGHDMQAFDVPFTDGQLDWMILDNVAEVLGGPPAFSLVERIMMTPLPTIVRD